jgi:multimeric flavodoxin WrbA
MATRSLTRRCFFGSAGVGAAGLLATTSTTRGSQAPAAKRKIVGISCSLRKGKTTAAALQVALQAAQEAAPDQIDIELIELADLSIPVAPVVGQALAAGQSDDFPAIQQKLSNPAVAGILVGTPVYFANMTSLCKAFLERCGAFRKAGFALGGKVAGVLAVGGVRSGGQELTIQSVQAALLCQEMVVVGDGRPTAHFGATLWNQQDKGIEDDEFGLGTACNLGRHVAQVVMKQEIQ